MAKDIDAMSDDELDAEFRALTKDSRDSNKNTKAVDYDNMSDAELDAAFAATKNGESSAQAGGGGADGADTEPTEYAKRSYEQTTGAEAKDPRDSNKNTKAIDYDNMSDAELDAAFAATKNGESSARAGNGGADANGRNVEMPDVSPGFIDYKAIVEYAAAEAQRVQKAKQKAKENRARLRRNTIDSLARAGIAEGAFVSFVGKDGRKENRYYEGLDDEGRPKFSNTNSRTDPLTSKFVLDLDEYDDLAGKGIVNKKVGKRMEPTEYAKRSYEQTTGAEAPENPILAQIANMGTMVGGRLNANIQMKAAQRLYNSQFLDGEKLHDDDVNKLFDEMTYGIAATDEMRNSQTIGMPGMFETKPNQPRKQYGVNQVLREWDETEGAQIADPKERSAARLQFAQNVAKDFIGDRSEKMGRAADEIERRGVSDAANFGTEGLKQLAYTGAFILGPAAVTAMTLEEAAANATGYTLDKYAKTDNGDIEKTSKGYDPETALAVGSLEAGFETASEYLGEGVMKLAGAVGKRALKETVGRIPLAKMVGGKVVESDAGKAVAGFARSVGRITDYAREKTARGGLIEEGVEEWLVDGLFNPLVSDSLKPENANTTAWSRFKKANSEFFDSENLVKLYEGMIITMGGQGAIAKLQMSRNDKAVDDVLRRNGLMKDDEIDSSSPEAKATALQAWVDGMNENDLKKHLDDARGFVDKLADKIEGSKDTKDIDEAVAAFKTIESRGIQNETKQIVKDLTMRGETPLAFQITTVADENGKATVGGEVGPDGSRRMTSNGVTVTDHGDGTIAVSDNSGNELPANSVEDAMAKANLLVLRNQNRDSIRNIKKTLLAAKVGVSENDLQPTDDGTGVALPNGIVVNLDKINTPQQMDEVITSAESKEVDEVDAADADNDGEVDATPPEMDEMLVGKEGELTKKLASLDANDPQRRVIEAQLRQVEAAKKRIVAREAEKQAAQEEGAGEATTTTQEPEVQVVEEKPIATESQKVSQTETKPITEEKSEAEPKSGVKTAVKEKPSAVGLKAKNGHDLPVDDHGVPTADVGTKLTADDGSEYEVQTRKDGSKRWKAIRGPRWTVDYGKTYHQGLVVGDRFTEDDYDNDKVPTKINFNNQRLKDGQVWEVETVMKDGSYNVKPVDAKPQSTIGEKPVEPPKVEKPKVDKTSPYRHLPTKFVEAAKKADGEADAKEPDKVIPVEGDYSLRRVNGVWHVINDKDDDLNIWHDENIDGVDEVTDDDRKTYSLLPDELIPSAKKVDAGEIALNNKTPIEHYPVDGSRFGLVKDENGKYHAVDWRNGDYHDELRQRQDVSGHRGPYIKQTAEADHYTEPFTTKRVPFEKLTKDQIKAQLKKFGGANNDWKRQRFEDDLFVYNDDYRKDKTNEAIKALKDAKSDKTLAPAIELAGHLAEIGGENVSSELTAALAEAKGRLLDIKLSTGGLSAADSGTKFGVKAWANTTGNPVGNAILANGKLFNNPDSNYMGDVFRGMSAEDRKFLLGGHYDDGTLPELMQHIGMNPDTEISGRGENTGAVVESIVNQALKARDEYRKWRALEVRKYNADRRAEKTHEVEILSRGRKYDVIANGEGYRLDELEARKNADDAYINAKAFVENEADENDYAILTPAHLVEAAAHPEKPTVLRLDHEKQTFTILTYDAKNGILTVYDPEDTSKPNRLFRVTADDIKEITHDARTEENAAGNVPADAQEQGEGKGGVQTTGSEGRGVVGGRRSAGMDRGAKAKVYRLFDPGAQEFDEKDALGAIEALDRGEVASVVDEDAAEISDKEISDWENGCKGVVLKTRDDAAHLLERLSNPDREMAKVFYVAKDGRIIKAKVVDIGLVGMATMPIDKILADIPEGTYGIITSHNHPDGGVKPSRPDVRSCLARAEEIAKKGIKFLEDFITDSDRYVSLGVENPWWQAVPEIVGDASGFWKDEGTTVEQPESRFNVIPYDERVNLISDDGSTYSKIASLSDRVAKVDHSGTYILGVSEGGDVLSAIKVNGHNDFGKAIGRCSRFIIFAGKDNVDRQWISDTLDGIAKKNGNEGEDFGIIAVVPLYEKGMSVYNGSLRCNDGYLNLDDMDMVLADAAREKGVAEDEIEEVVKLGKEKLKEKFREGDGTTLTEDRKEKDNKPTTTSGEDNKVTTARKKKVTSKLTGNAEKKAASVFDRMKKFKGTLKAPVEKLQAAKDDREIKSLLKEFGETKDIAHALLVAPSGKMVSDANAFIGHDTFGEVTVKAAKSSLDAYADDWEAKHPGKHFETPGADLFNEFESKVAGRDFQAATGAQNIYAENHLFGDGTMTVEQAVAAYNAHKATGGIYSLLKKGAIRVASNNGGLEIGTIPTEKQIGFIYDYADWHAQNDGRGFSVDFVGENGARDSVYYDKHVAPSKIVDDARSYFTTGKIEKNESSIRDFLYAPVEKLEGGVKGIYTGSRIDYDTANGLFGIGANGVKPTFGWGLYGSKRRETAVNYAGGKNKGVITEQTWFAGKDKPNLLKWSAPVGADDQKRIRENWKKEFGGDLPKSVQLTSGATAYRTIEKALGSNVKASEFLSRAGIDGMNSGDLYVAFSPDGVHVDAKEKDGVRAPVEQLAGGFTKEQRRELRDMTEDLVEALSEAGMGDFESLVRYIVENDKDTYDKLRPYLANAYNSATDQRISVEEERRVYDIIDEEIKNENADEETDGTGGDRLPESEREDQPSGEGSNQTGGLAGVHGSGTGRTGHQESDGRGDGAGGRGRHTGLGADGHESVQQPGDVSGGHGESLRGTGGGRGGSGVQSGNGGGNATDAVPADHGESVGAGELRDVQPSGSVEDEVTPGFVRYKAPESLPVQAPSSKSLIVETSALASTPAPKIEKKPNIPDEIPESGTLQAHQYHSVCQAVNAHEKFLPDGRRYGYFCADGTGCGKTRIIAGIMLDAIRNMHGNGKCLIVSQKENLFDDAVKDFTPFGIGEKLFKLDSGKVGTKSPLAVRGQGIAFTMYNRLAKDYNGTDADGEVRFSAGKKACQFNDILKWLGGTKPEDYDGVIAFDEVHTASKDSADSKRKQATYAQAVIDLQRLLPKARIVYLTATAAYDPDNLRFLERMGLWGEGTGFKTRNDFVAAFGRNSENVSLMEVMTQGLKSRGLYCARSISFKGVKCKRFIQKLTPEQREMHNEIRKAMFAIHGQIANACDLAGYSTGVAMKQFFGSGLRIFGSMMTAFKVQKAVELGKTALAEGKCPIFQIIETGAAAKEDKAKQIEKKHNDTLFDLGSNDVEDDPTISLRDKLIKFLKTDACFPSHEYLGRDEKTEKPIWGSEIPEAAELRDRLIAMVEQLPKIGNPIDLIEAAFREDGVSRVTGEVPAKKRGEIIDAFNNGDNRVLIFSAAGGTGASYHASPKFKNKRQRVQIPIEFGWKPEDFIQALGRSHRNNQVIAPEFWLLTTDMPGEMRFISTVASRIASMGAIVGGDRNSSGQVVGSGDSIDNVYGRATIGDFAEKVAAGNGYAGVPSTTITSEMMIPGNKMREIDTEKFLGRLQLLSFDSQKAIYDKVAENMQTRIDEAKEAGEYDDGIKKIDARRVVVKERKGVEGADVGIVTTGEWHKSPRLSNEDFERKANGEKSRIIYARNKRSGNLFGFINAANGKIYQYSPSRGYVGIVEPMDYRANFDSVPSGAAKDEWDEKYGATPAEIESEASYVTGDLFPVWNKIGVDYPSVLRGTPENSKPFIGVKLVDAQLANALYGFGKKDEARKLFSEKGFEWLKRGTRYGIGEGREQPLLQTGTISGQRVMMVRNLEANGAVADYLAADPHWERGWYKDPNIVSDRGDDVMYMPLGKEGAEDAYEYLVGKFGVFQRKDGNLRFASKDPTGVTEDYSRPMNRPTRETAGVARGGGKFGINIDIHQEGDSIVFRPKDRAAWKGLDAVKKALGGVETVSRRGERYVKSNIICKQNYDKDRKLYKVPMSAIPQQYHAELLDNGTTLKAEVEPIRQLMRDPKALSNAVVYDILRAEVMPLDAVYEKKDEDELVKIALADPDAVGAIGALYQKAHKKLPGMIRKCCRLYHPKPEEVYDIESNVWTAETEQGGILQEFRNKNAELFEKGFEKVLWSKAERFTKDYLGEAIAGKTHGVTGLSAVRARKHYKETGENLFESRSLDRKRDGFNEDEGARLIESDIDNAGFADQVTDTILSAINARSYDNARKRLAEIFTQLDDYGMPEKYMGWLRKYLEEVGNLGVEFDVDNIGLFNDYEHRFVYERGHKVDKFLINRRKYIERNILKRLGQLGRNPQKLFEHEFGQMLKAIRLWQSENDSRFLPGEDEANASYSNAELIDIMKANGDEDWADVCRERENGLTGEEIAKKLGMTHDNVRQILHRANEDYGYHYEGPNVNRPVQTNWFDLLGVPGEITKTPKVEKKAKAKSNVVQDDLFGGILKAPVEPLDHAVTPEEDVAYLDWRKETTGIKPLDPNDKSVRGVFGPEQEVRKAVEGYTNLPQFYRKKKADGLTRDEKIAEIRKEHAASIARTSALREWALNTPINVMPFVDDYGVSLVSKDTGYGKPWRVSRFSKHDDGYMISAHSLYDTKDDAVVEAESYGAAPYNPTILFAPVEKLEAPVEPIDPADNRGFYNEEIDRFRKDMGLSPLKKDATVSLESIDKRGRAMANNELEMIKSINAWSLSNYVINAEEQAALDYYGVKLSQEAANLHARMKQAEANGDKVIAEQLHDQIFNDILPRLENIQKVQRRVGREWGLAGRIRQLMYGPDMSIATFMVACRKAAGGKLPDNVAKQAGILWDKLHDANIAIKDNQDMVAVADQVVRAMKVVKKVDDEAKAKRRGAPGEAKIIENYANALLQIEHWGKVKGGVLAAIPNIHKLMTDMMGYYYLTGKGYGDDGKPSMDKITALARLDLHNCGIDADDYDIRQAICEMGKLSQPSKNEIEKAKRETRKQMLLAQQMSYFMEHGELPPKTGWEDIEDSDVIREMRRMRDRMFKDAKDKAGSDTRLASALKRMKTAYRNKIEDLEKKIALLKSGGTLPEEAKSRGVTPDEELQRLINEKKDREEELKALNDPDGTKELEKQTIRLIDRLTKHAKKLQDELDLAKSLGTGYEWNKDTMKPWDNDPRVKAIRDRIAEINKEKKELHNELFPEGTPQEQAKYFDRREAALQRQFEVWDKALKNIESATTIEEKLKAAKPYGTRAATKENLKTLELKKNRDAAHKKCLDLLKQIERDNYNFNLGNIMAWASFVNDVPRIFYTMLDAGFAGVQGARQFVMHPKLWLKATKRGVASLVSQKETDKVVIDLNRNPYTDEFAKHSGHLYTMEGLGGDTDVPEDFAALAVGPKWFGGKTVDLRKVWGIKQSERSFAAFLNQLNVDLYRRIVEANSQGGPLTDYQKFCIARFVNESTCYGYGTKNPYVAKKDRDNALVKMLESFAWAPRKVFSEIKFFLPLYHELLEPFLGTVKYGPNAVSIKDAWGASKMIFKEKARFWAGVLAIAVAYALGKILFDDDDDFDFFEFINPLSNRFMEAEVNHEKYDILFGGGKYIRSIARIATGLKMENGVYKKISPWRELGKFFATKAAPIYTKTAEAVFGENVFGMPIDKSASGLVKNFLLPITWSGMIENYNANKDDPISVVFNALGVFFGFAKYAETDYDPLKRPADQTRAMDSAYDQADDQYDENRKGEIDKWFDEAVDGVKRSEVGDLAKDVISDEKLLKNNEARLSELKELLKKAWKKSESDKIKSEIRNIERENDGLRKSIPEDRKKAEESVRKFKWPSSSMR